MLAAGVGIVVLTSSSQSDQAPRSRPTELTKSIRIPPTVSLGDVAYGEIVPFSIIVTNDSSQDLVLDRITTNCGCTTTTQPPLVVPAHSASAISGDFRITEDVATTTASTAVRLESESADKAWDVAITAQPVAPLSTIEVRDGEVHLQLHPRYAGVVKDIRAYADASERSLPVKIAGGSIFVATSGVAERSDSLQMVLELSRRRRNERYSIAQDIIFSHPASSSIPTERKTE